MYHLKCGAGLGGWKGYEISEFRLVFVCGRGLESTSKSILYHLTNLSRKKCHFVLCTNNEQQTCHYTE